MATVAANGLVHQADHTSHVIAVAAGRVNLNVSGLRTVKRMLFTP
jgi:hypothetical protein